MAPFRLATIERNGWIGSGIVVAERIYSVREIAPSQTELHGELRELLDDWDHALPALRAIAAGVDGITGGYPSDDSSIRVLTPIRYPGAIFCTVFNYYDFAAEAGVTPPDKSCTRPYVSMKLPRCAIGPNDAIELPTISQQVDWEVELGVVIGRQCRGVFSRDALDYVAGYTIVNDISGRDVITRPDWPNFGSDWLMAKNFDTSSPIGPYLLPREFMPDIGHVPLRLTRNGVLMQNGTTNSMIFTVEEQIEFLSSVMTLQPGDVIATGTPAGVGWKRGVFLQAGDEVVCEIDGIGTLRNTVTAAMPMMAPGRTGTAFA